jgi:hypothetical protein
MDSTPSVSNGRNQYHEVYIYQSCLISAETIQSREEDQMGDQRRESLEQCIKSMDDVVL